MHHDDDADQDQLGQTNSGGAEAPGTEPVTSDPDGPLPVDEDQVANEARSRRAGAEIAAQVARTNGWGPHMALAQSILAAPGNPAAAIGQAVAAQVARQAVPVIAPSQQVLNTVAETYAVRLTLGEKALAASALRVLNNTVWGRNGLAGQLTALQVLQKNVGNWIQPSIEVARLASRVALPAVEVVQRSSGLIIHARHLITHQLAPILAAQDHVASIIARHARIFSQVPIAIGWITNDFRWWLGDILRRVRDFLDVTDDELDLYTAALSTRAAILRDKDSKPIVENFTRKYLRLRRMSVHLIDAVVGVLLEDEWHESSMSDDELFAHLRNRVLRTHQDIRPITDARLGGRYVASLEERMALHPTIGLTNSGQLNLGPYSVEDQVIESIDGFEDPTIRWIASKLDPTALKVMNTWAGNTGSTWPEAAVAVGVDPATGEAIRRRIHYLSKVYQPRLQAIAGGTAVARRSR